MQYTGRIVFWALLSFPVGCESSNHSSSWSASLFGIAIHDIAITEQVVWLATDEGLIRIEATDTVTYSPVNSPIMTYNITTVEVDSKGRVWFGDGTEGLMIFDGLQWSRLYSFNSRLTSKVISDIVFEDSLVWLAAGAAVARLTPNDTLIYTAESAPLPSSPIVALDVVTPGELWIASFGGGVIRKKGNQWTTFTTANSSIRNNSIFDVTHGPDGRVWVGEGGGLDEYDGQHWTNYNSLNSPLPQNDVTAISVSNNNRVWMGMYEGGVTSLAGNHWTIYNVTNSSVPSQRVLSMGIDANGRIWAGTPLGLAVFR